MQAGATPAARDALDLGVAARLYCGRTDPPPCRIPSLAMLFRAALLHLAFLGLAAAPAAAQQVATAPATSIDEAQNGAVRVVAIMETFQGRYLHSTGSGFVVAPNLAVTNAHVASVAMQYPNIRMAIVAPNGEGMAPAEVIRYSPEQDLALLRFSGESPPALTISTVAPRPGDAIVALGYPDLDDLDRPATELVRPTAPSRSNGAIAALRDIAPTGQPIPTINHEATISSGSSGGPLLDECGRVVGVNTWHTRGRETLQGRGVATRAAQLVQFLRTWGVTPIVSAERCLSPVERAQAERDAALAALQQKIDEMAKAPQQGGVGPFSARDISLIAGTFFFAAALALLGYWVLMGRRARPPAPADAAHRAASGGRPIINLGRKAPAQGALGGAQTPPPDAATVPGEPPVPELAEAPAPRSVWPAVLGAAALAAAIALVAPVATSLFSTRGPGATRTAADIAGVQDCVFDALASGAPGENRSFTIDANACVDGALPYAPTTDGRALRRVALLSDLSALEVQTLSPDTGELRNERFTLAPAQRADALEAARSAPAARACSPAAREQTARRNAALLRFAEGDPAQRIVWRCRRRS